MKRSLLAAVSLVLCSAAVFSGCSLFYDYTYENGVGIGYSKIEKSAFVADIGWKTGDSFTIVLPNEYNGIPIKELGGYFGRGVPSPFRFMIDINALFPDCDDCYATDEKRLYDEPPAWWNNAEITNCDFVITLPSRLERIRYVSMDVFVAVYNLEDGTVFVKIIRPTYYFYISGENAAFYTKDGKLYDKKTNALIDEFVYG